MSGTGVLLVLLGLLQIKHLLADFIFQSDFIIQNRRQYGHPGGLLHASIHGVGSLAVLFAAGPAVGTLALAVVVAEVVIHYHIDWSKDQLTTRLALTQSNSAYWWLMGTDQTLHQLTYLAMVGIWSTLY